MRTISLFAGCGGMDLGAESAGAEIVYANEIDKQACGTLERVFPKSEIDNRTIKDVKSFPAADLVIGGYPCQSFSMGGNRDPKKDSRTYLYLEFARCLSLVRPPFFVAENVVGLKRLQGGTFLADQQKALGEAGEHGYRLTVQEVDAKSFGVPQTRKRVLLVGVRRDLDRVFVFPQPTHGKATRREPHLKPFTSHGEAIKDLPLWPSGEFYERPHDPEGHWSWYYMSRNRKAPWAGPSYTVVANWRHITLHPASFTMKLTWSNLADGWKQRWDFSGEYEHTAEDSSRPVLPEPRRLSWRECARIQTFPRNFEPVGDVESKFTQIGNAVPPLLAEVIIRRIVDGSGVMTLQQAEKAEALKKAGSTRRAASSAKQMTLWD